VKRLSKIIALSMMFILVVGNIVQAKNGWEIQIEPMLMDVDGYDEHVGDIYRSREEYSEDTAGNVTLDLSTTYEPLNLNMKDEFTLRGELIYRKGQWNLGASSWWFSADGSVIGTVTTPEEETTATGYVYYINGVRMWDNTIIPVYNELEDSLFSPVDYWAEDRLAVWTADLFLSRILAEKKDSYVSFCLGAKLGSLKTEENVGQKQRAFVYDYDYGCNFDNHITLEGMAEADCGFMAGPVLGFKGKAERGKFGIEGFLSQSIVFGKVEHTGLW